MLSADRWDLERERAERSSARTALRKGPLHHPDNYSLAVILGKDYIGPSTSQPQMTVHVFPGAGYDSNCFLISGDKPILVDAGTGTHHARLLRSIAQVATAVRTIVLTHRHYDHVGGARELSTALGAEVLMHELDAPPVREGSASATVATMFGRTIEPVEVTGLDEGDVLDTGDHQFTIIHTPGHTAGGISLHEPATGILLSGDTVFAGGVGRWDMPTGDRASLVRSVKRLAALRPVDLYPGHGPCAQGNAGDHMKEAMNYLGE